MQTIKARQKDIRREFKSIGLSVNFKVYPYSISFKNLKLLGVCEMNNNTDFEVFDKNSGDFTGLIIKVPQNLGNKLTGLIDDIENGLYGDVQSTYINSL
jgi:hypothetical protein